MRERRERRIRKNEPLGVRGGRGSPWYEYLVYPRIKFDHARWVREPYRFRPVDQPQGAGGTWSHPLGGI
jgi:hypothetical protein